MHSLRLCAVLKITHSADGLWLFAGVAVASMEHLGVPLLSTAILGVLVTCKGSTGETREHLKKQLEKIRF